MFHSLEDFNNCKKKKKSFLTAFITLCNKWPMPMKSV